MEPLQLTKQATEELAGRPLNDDEVAEMVSSLTMFVEMLAEIDQTLSKTSTKQKNNIYSLKEIVK